MIAVEHLQIEQGAFRMDDVDLHVPAGQYAVLMGKTGSGKTTILEAICGLRGISGGRITLADRDVTGLKPAERGIGYVPQDGALFPSMTVAEQLSFSLDIRRWPRDKVDQRVAELADQLGIAHLLDRRPTGLSGGERQRVALGRALAFRPRVLCMDEPLSALDDETREQLYGLLRSIREHNAVTTLHVTHNLAESRELADVVFVLREGRVEAEEC